MYGTTTILDFALGLLRLPAQLGNLLFQADAFLLSLKQCAKDLGECAVHHEAVTNQRHSATRE